MKKLFTILAIAALALFAFSSCNQDDTIKGKDDSKEENNGNYGDQEGEQGGEQGGEEGGEQGGGQSEINYTLCEDWAAAYHGRGYVEALEMSLDIVSVSGVTDRYFIMGVFGEQLSGKELTDELNALYDDAIDEDGYIYLLEGPSNWDGFEVLEAGEYYVYILGISETEVFYEPSGKYGVAKIAVNGSAYDNAFGDLNEYDWGGGEGGEGGEVEAPASWTLKPDWKAEYVGYENYYGTEYYYLSYTGVTDDDWTFGLYNEQLGSEDMDYYLPGDATRAYGDEDNYLSSLPDYDWSFIDGEFFDNILPGEVYVYIIGLDYDNYAVTGNYGLVKVNMTKNVEYDGRYDDFFAVPAAPSSRVLRIKGSSLHRPARSNKCATAAMMKAGTKRVRVLAK